MIYKCGKCGYSTKQKSHFNSHMNKINPCSNEIVVFSNEEWSCEINKYNQSFNSINDLNKLTKTELIEIIKSYM